MNASNETHTHNLISKAELVLRFFAEVIIEFSQRETHLSGMSLVQVNVNEHHVCSSTQVCNFVEELMATVGSVVPVSDGCAAQKHRTAE